MPWAGSALGTNSRCSPTSGHTCAAPNADPTLSEPISKNTMYTMLPRRDVQCLLLWVVCPSAAWEQHRTVTPSLKRGPHLRPRHRGPLLHNTGGGSAQRAGIPPEHDALPWPFSPKSPAAQVRTRHVSCSAPLWRSSHADHVAGHSEHLAFLIRVVLIGRQPRQCLERAAISVKAQQC